MDGGDLRRATERERRREGRGRKMGGQWGSGREIEPLLSSFLPSNLFLLSFFLPSFSLLPVILHPLPPILLPCLSPLLLSLLSNLPSFLFLFLCSFLPYFLPSSSRPSPTSPAGRPYSPTAARENGARRCHPSYSRYVINYNYRWGKSEERKIPNVSVTLLQVQSFSPPDGMS